MTTEAVVPEVVTEAIVGAAYPTPLGDAVVLVANTNPPSPKV
jgi:hypothetical protein